MPLGSVIGSILGPVIQGILGKKAAKQQVAGQQAGIDTITGFNQPFIDAGRGALNPLADFLQEGGNFGDTQAFKDIVNTNKSQGGTLSGNQLTELTRFNAVNFRPQRFNELFSVAQLGAGTAGRAGNAIAGLQEGIGATRAGGTLGVGNAITGGINQLSFLDLLKKNPELLSGGRP